jgi:23S rRNA (cytosine1962-C5)-methyltransferase
LKPATSLKIRVSRAAEKSIRSGHPWVYSNSVRETSRPGSAGELGVIYDSENAFLAVGFYEPKSPLAIKILEFGKAVKIDECWIESKLSVAMGKRSGLEAENTTGYRYVHGESDGMPGFILDRYDTSYVLKLYTFGWVKMLEAVQKGISKLVQPERLVLRLSRNIQEASAAEGWKEGQVLNGAAVTEPIVFRENGLAFEADIVKGQKTGFFLDQRENRKRVMGYARGKTVLNVFSYSGGFSVYAAAGGARQVASLDISEHALQSSLRNFALNQDNPLIRQAQHQIIKADAFKWVKESTQKFDLVILDPPSLAKRQDEKSAALSAYSKLSADGIKNVSPLGMLVASSCSAHVTRDEFVETVLRNCKKSGRVHRVLEQTSHASDHPFRFPEAEYLKTIYVQFER